MPQKGGLAKLTQSSNAAIVEARAICSFLTSFSWLGVCACIALIQPAASWETRRRRGPGTGELPGTYSHSAAGRHASPAVAGGHAASRGPLLHCCTAAQLQALQLAGDGGRSASQIHRPLTCDHTTRGSSAKKLEARPPGCCRCSHALSRPLNTNSSPCTRQSLQPRSGSRMQAP